MQAVTNLHRTRSLQRDQLQQSTDVRGERTRRAVRRAVEDLSAEGRAGLTVRAIVERAGVSRSTFYAHYSDVSDLAESLMVEAMEEVAREEQRMLKNSARPTSLHASLLQLLDHLVRNRALYEAALSLPGSDRAYRRAVGTIADVAARHLMRSPIPEGVDPEIAAQWIAWGQYGVYDAWLRGAIDASPAVLAQTSLSLLPRWYRDPDADGETRAGSV